MSTPTQFKLTKEDRRIMDALAKRLGLTRAAVLRVAIRELDRKEKEKAK